MPAFNKRHRETTYMGMKMRPLGALASFVICAFMAFTTIFNNSAWGLGSMLILMSVSSLLYAIYELAHGEDYRIRLMRFKSRVVRNTKQAMQ